MKFCPVNVWLLLFVAGSLAQELDLLDAFDLTPPPKAAEPKPTRKPKANDDDLNLFDALGPDPEPKKPSKPAGGDSGGLDILDTLDFDKPAAPSEPKKPAGGDDMGFDLEDALGPDPKPEPNKPVKPPSTGGGGGSFDDSDLADVGAGGYKPDGGDSGGRHQNYDDSNGQGGAGETKGAETGQIAGIASAIGVAILGAASSYFAYQKKKLCFKLQGGADPESGKGHQGTHSEPQVLSNLLSSS